MSHNIYKGVPYVAHNKIQYMNMRGRVVLKMIAFVPSTFGLTTIKQAYITPPPPLPPTPHFSRRPPFFIKLVPAIENRNVIYVFVMGLNTVYVNVQ